MKKNAKRWLAMLLCLTMALTLLPAMALPSFAQETGQEENIPDNTGSQDEQGAGQGDEQAEEAGAGNNDLGAGELEDDESNPAGDSNDIAGQAYEDLPDGALVDNWVQDSQTVRGTGAVCEVTDDGHLRLKAGSGNKNNGDHWTGTGTDGDTGPAVFLSSEMIEDLTADTDGSYKVSFKVKPLVDSCWGIYLNYKDPAHGFLVGYNNPGGGWFQQSYNGTGDVYGNTEKPTLTVGETYQVEVSWNAANKTATVKFGDTTLGTDMSYSAVCNSITDPDGGVINNFALKVGVNNDNVSGDIEVWDLHYSGQTDERQPDPTYTVSGTVTDGTNPIEGATVTLTKGEGSDAVTKTAATDAEGKYAFTSVENGTYTLSVSADGFEPATVAGGVVVNNDNATKDLSLTRISSQTRPTDGVTEDTWKQDENTVRGTGSICAVEDGRLHLKATSTNTNNGGNNTNPPAMFINETMNAALAAATEEEKTLSFDIEPVAASVNGNPLFGIYLNYKSEANAVWGKAICIDTNAGHWFWQSYYEGADSWGDIVSNSTAFKADGKNHIELKWKDQAITSFKVNDTVLVSSEITMAPIVSAIGQLDSVGFKVGSHTNTNSVGDFYISNFHYTGQKEVTVYNVSGTVTDGTAPMKDVTVSAGGSYTTTTAANGSYNLVLPEGIYTITASKDGYEDAAIDNVNVNAVLTGQDITLTKLAKVSGKVTEEGDAAKAVSGAAVTLTKGTGQDAVVKTGATKADGTYSITGVPNGEYTVTVSCDGYETNKLTDKLTVSGHADATLNATLKVSEIPHEVLETATMTVQVSTAFPQVIKYIMKSDNSVLWGQSTALDTLTLNGKAVKPTVATPVVSADKKTITYTMTVDESNNNGTNLNVVITAHITVGIDSSDNTLGFFIDSVEYSKGDRQVNPLETIEIPNHSLVSVRSTDEGQAVAVTGAKPGGGTYVNGDVTYHIDNEKNKDLSWSGNYFAAFVYNGKFSAGLASNSEYGNGNGGSNNYPVCVTFEPKNNGAVESIGLSSMAWYWDRKVSSVNSGAWENSSIPEANKVIGPIDSEKGYAKVSIAVGDQNGDDKMDWQDGAIVYRDTVMHKPANSEGDGLVGIRDAVSMRINLNFGSQAQHPFLMSLDNVKRMALSTDGLGQLILMKGYAGEGHDSNHPDYWDIGERMGGVDDFNLMLEEGKELGAQFGIHVNASEFYPEAQAFNNETVGRYNVDTTDSYGVFHPAQSLRYGWNWIDQGINMNVLYDFASGNRAKRFNDLYKLVGDRLSFVYVDVWGNNQHGVGEDAWMTRKLTNEITDGTSWRIAHEWSYANPYDSTFQHWTSDYTYGDGNYKGHNNSNVLRFLLNSYRDSFPADFATFGGACNAPLLGGPSMQGFEGWQKDDEYDLAVENTFNQMVATKFLQHFDIVEWINADNAVTIPYNLNANNARTSSAEWTPEMQITLKDKKTGDTVVVTRGLDSTLDTTAEFSLDNEVEYRSRVITLNGREILRGAPASAGEDKAFPESKATQQYLIPWFWDAQGERFKTDKEVKLYHWNAKGGTSTWELPESWETLSTVTYYELSDQGRGEAQTLTVTGGSITFPDTIKANTGYVVVQDTTNKGPEFEWSTGLHVKDASFNIDMANSDWTSTGSTARVRNPGGISALELTGESSVKQVMTGLTAGQKYVAYVGVDNLSNTEAAITISDETGKVLASNYTLESIAVNYVSGYSLHTAAGLETTGGFRDGRESRFQNMYVFFTPETGHTYTMTLSHEGPGKAYFAGVRVLETEAVNFEYDADGSMVKFTQDFEHVAQGMYPFVVSGIEGVEDNRQHLSELHAPYTQAGWDVKQMDDVLEGNWSVKVNGLTQRNTLVFQTIPQNIRFEPGETYFVTFKYQMGSAGIYKLVIGDGKYTNLNNLQQIDLQQGMGKDQDNTCTFTIKGSESGQTWFGIYSTSVAPASNDSFTGHKEIVVDDLVIVRSVVNRSALNDAIDTASAMDLADYVVADGVTEDEETVKAGFTTALTNARTVLGNKESTQAEVDAAANALKGAIAKLKKIVVTISGTVTGAGGAPLAGATVILEDPTYMPTGLTVETKADGKFQFQDTDAVKLHVLAYKLKVAASGYDVVTEDVTLTKAAPNAVKNITLTPEVPGAYVNNFDSGDVSMMNTFDEYVGGTENDNGPRVFVAESGDAVQVAFVGWQDTKADGRWENNLMDKSGAAKFANGTVSFDVTPLHCGDYFGITLRGVDKDHRIYIGQESDPSKWFAEWWNGEGHSYTGITTAPITMTTGVTRRVSVTLNDLDYLVTLDGVKVLEGTLDAGAPTAAGYAGINMKFSWDGTGPEALGNYGAQYVMDNFRVKSTDAAVVGTYTIAGTVTDKNGGVVAGADVSVLDAAGERVTGTSTNAAGQYETPAVEPGTYTVKVSAPFAIDKELSVEVTSANVTGKDFVLDPDIASLTDLITEVEALTESDYTAESWAVLAEALTAAKAINADSTIAALSAAYRGLSSAKDALVEREPAPVDYSELRALYKELVEKENAGYTDDSWDDFQAALDAAQAVLSKADATQAEVDAAKDNLQTAYDALSVPPVPSTPDTPSTSTEVKENPDGSITTTVTDKKTGTVTETTEKPDGTKEIVETKKDGTVTETKVDPEGGAAEKVTDPEKNVAIKVTDADGEVLAEVKLPAEVTVPETRFEDVPEGHWADEAIHEMAGLQVVNGVGNNEYNMNGSMKRGDLALLLARLSNAGTDYDVKFTDVPADKYYAGGVAWAAKAGVVTGRSPELFKPEDTITRGELAVMLYRYAKLLKMDTSASASELDVFTDGKDTAEWAADGVAWCVKNGIMQGKGGSILDSKSNVTRAEVAVMLQRFTKLMK